jgi:hypothetical protein
MPRDFAAVLRMLESLRRPPRGDAPRRVADEILPREPAETA